jgi:hypothetical protein
MLDGCSVVDEDAKRLLYPEEGWEGPIWSELGGGKEFVKQR